MTVLITGAGKGIGFATATEILLQKEDEVKAIASPRGKQATPEEIAREIYFLSLSRNIIGEVLVSDGGRRLF